MNFTDFLNTITATAGNVAQIVRPPGAPTAPTAPTAPSAPGSMPKWLIPAGIGLAALVLVISLVKR